MGPFGPISTVKPGRSALSSDLLLWPTGSMRNDAHGRTAKAKGILIRRVRPSDTEALSAFYATLSAESLHARFLGYTRGISGAVSRSFCSLDHMHDEGFVALASEPLGKRVVGHLCLASVGSRRLELGVAVADQYQGRAIGRLLFEAATSWAQEHHFTSIAASCYADNSRILALLTSAPSALVEAAVSGVVEVVIPLEPRRRLRSTTRVASRRTPQPAPAAEGSAWRGSSSRSS